MKRLIIIMFIMLIMSGCSKRGEYNLKYDNSISANSAISKIYTQYDIDNLKNDLNINIITYNQVKKRFNIQCLRKTHQGYYSILNMETGERAFLFFSDDLKLTKILEVNNFYSKDDFNFIQINETTLDEIDLFDKCAIYYKISAVHVTGHILEDGILVVFYNRMIDGILLESPIVKSIEFIENAKFEEDTENFWINNTPFILPLDKH